MTGAGAPPHTIGGVVDPLPRCFLYQAWYDFANNIYYSLNTDLQGEPVEYDKFEPGDQLLLLNKITAVENPARLGSVLAGATIFNLQACLNSESANLVANNQARTSIDNTQRVLNCAIAKSNRGSISYVFGNPPIPVVLDALQQNAGYVTNPDFIVTPGIVAGEQEPFNGFQDFGWQVFVRDKSVNRYYRDTFNSPLTEPDFPEQPCDGDMFVDEQFGLVYEFSADKCRWYLLDGTDAVVDALSQTCDPINLGLEPSAGTLAVEDGWDCDCGCGPSSGCGGCC